MALYLVFSSSYKPCAWVWHFLQRKFPETQDRAGDGCLLSWFLIRGWCVAFSPPPRHWVCAYLSAETGPFPNAPWLSGLQHIPQAPVSSMLQNELSETGAGGFQIWELQSNQDKNRPISIFNSSSHFLKTSKCCQYPTSARTMFSFSKQLN